METNVISHHRFIFVCGLHRSGTSVLFRALRDHPAVSGFQDTSSPENEGMHLQTVYRPSGHYGGAAAFGFHPEAHLTEHSALVSDANRQKLFCEWSRYWDLSREYLLEKSPPNLIRTRFLQAMFPDSYFIVLLRHPLAVSYATQKWYRRFRVNWRSLPRILEHWLICHEIFRADQVHLGRSLVFKYEHFVADPAKWMHEIQGFLDLPAAPMNQQVFRNVNEKYFGKWQRNLSGLLTGIGARSMVRRFEARVKSFGYSLIDLDWTGPVEV